MTEDKKDFRVNLGDSVQLQFIPEGNRERLNAKIIGHSPGQSLIISAPKIKGKMPFLKENQPFVIRMLQGNNVYGFESSVIKSYSIPFPHIHLRDPTDIECITVRGSRRIETELIVSVTSELLSNKPLSISMQNTSATGALLQTSKELGGLGDKVSISIELEVVNIKKYLRINAIIRNISTPENRSSKSDDLNKYGVQFIDLNDDQNLLINAYVYEQIVIHLEDR